MVSPGSGGDGQRQDRGEPTVARENVGRQVKGNLDAPGAGRQDVAELGGEAGRPDQQRDPLGSPGCHPEEDAGQGLEAGEAADGLPGPRVDHHGCHLTVCRDGQLLPGEVAH